FPERHFACVFARLFFWHSAAQHARWRSPTRGWGRNHFRQNRQGRGRTMLDHSRLTLSSKPPLHSNSVPAGAAHEAPRAPQARGYRARRRDAATSGAKPRRPPARGAGRFWRADPGQFRRESKERNRLSRPRKLGMTANPTPFEDLKIAFTLRGGLVFPGN